MYQHSDRHFLGWQLRMASRIASAMRAKDASDVFSGGMA
jgi:hypothetical protein